jgi:hypothetical protein
LAYNFQSARVGGIKLLTEYENVTQKVFLHRGGYVQSSKQMFVVYLTAEKLVQLIFVGFEETLPGFHQLFL